MCKRRGFTLIELLVVISIIALLIAILLPALSAARRTARQMQSNTHIRGIHTSLVAYAQGNKTYYPGLNDRGDLENPIAPWDVYDVLLDRGYFAGNYALSPAEVKVEWTGSPVTTDNYSYSMLSIFRRQEQSEWQDTVNAEAIVLSDRAIGIFGTVPNIRSVWNVTDSVEEWQGGVGWNDNHVTYESTYFDFITRYGINPANVNDATGIGTDRLFENDSNITTNGNAFMVYDGTGALNGQHAYDEP